MAFPLKAPISRIKKRFGPLVGTYGIGSIPPVIKQLRGYDLGTLKAELCLWNLEGEPFGELAAYLERDFLRFVHTVALVPEQSGRLLELGACPYFMTMLLKLTRQYELVLANFFSTMADKTGVQRMIHRVEPRQQEFRFNNFNSECDSFPYESDSFDVVLFCEILEHLTEDPAHTISEINRVLKMGGYCVLTTPNVNRFENIRKLLLGENVYDQYSGYGPYGRHNREYTLGEVQHLFTLHGFQIDVGFTTNVWPEQPGGNTDMLDVLLKKLMYRRKNDIGEYLFVKAQKITSSGAKRSHVFYRSRHDIVSAY